MEEISGAKIDQIPLDDVLLADGVEVRGDVLVVVAVVAVKRLHVLIEKLYLKCSQLLFISLSLLGSIS